MGKSTLLNALVGEQLSVITPKPQTTRHRIIAIANDDNYQIVFSDTPGFIEEPSYRMQELMNTYILTALEDADILLFVTNPSDPLNDQHHLLKKIARHPVPVFVIINKADLANTDQLTARENELSALLPGRKVFTVSAVKGKGLKELKSSILSTLPEGPPYYPKDQLTDRPERFFVSEIIRGKILEYYHEEIPYSCEIGIESFSEGESKSGPITRISAVIYTMDERKKSILLGKAGAAIKEVGTASRKEIESFLGKRVFLELIVKVRDNWRDDDKALKTFGYKY